MWKIRKLLHPSDGSRVDGERDARRTFDPAGAPRNGIAAVPPEGGNGADGDRIGRRTEGVHLGFGPYAFDPERRVLWRDGRLVRMRPQPAAVLELLLRRADTVVLRDEIRAHLWPDGTVVDYEAGINHAVRQVRTALRDDAATARYVETMPRVGYRFVGRITPYREANGAAPGAEQAVETGARGDLEAGSAQARASAGPRAGDVPGERESQVRPSHGRAAVMASVVLALASVVAATSVSWVSNGRAVERETAPFARTAVDELTGRDTLISVAVSPDGRHFAGSRYEDGGFNITLAAVDSDRDRVLADGLATPPKRLRFSPDGARLYFLRSDGPGPGYSSLYDVSVLGDAAPRKVLFDVDSGVAPSPDGERFAFVRGFPDRGETAILTASVAGGDVETVAVTRSPDVFRELAWSPDGRRLAVARWTGGSVAPFEIDLVDLAAGETRTLAEHRWDVVESIVWSPDGDELWLTARRSDTDDRARIWRVSVDSGDRARILNDTGAYTGLTRVADGGALVALRSERETYLDVVSADGSGRVESWRGGSRPRDRVLEVGAAPDGAVLFTTREEGRFALWRLDGPGAPPVRLLPPFVAVSPRFDVDRAGDHVVLAGPGEDGARHVYRAPLDGGEPRRLTSVAGARLPAACPGDDGVYFARSGETGLWYRAASGGEPRRVYPHTPYFEAPRCSPDGRRLAFDVNLPRPDGRLERNLVVWSTETETAERLVPWPDGALLRWLPSVSDRVELSFVSERDGRSTIRALDLETGDVRRVSARGCHRIFSYDWSNDGRRIYVVHGRTRADAVRVRDLG